VTTTAAAALAAFHADSDIAAARKRLGAALPTTGWLADYVRVVTPLTDTPVEFSLISGMCALSTALGNSLWYETWGQRVYPHLWAVLVAPSSFWRKSTAINMAERLVAEAEESRVLPSDFSREKFLEELSVRPVGMLSLKDFGGFLANLGRDYMAGTREMMTELYDGPEMYSRALKGKTYVVRRPAITLLAATTLDWLESRITEGDLRGGFLGRFLFVTATDKASPKGLTGGMDGLIRMHLRDDLRALAETPESEVRLTRPARELLDTWLAGWEDEVTSSHHATDLTGFAVRLQIYVLKFAVIYRASTVVRDEPGSVVEIGIEPLRSAIAYCRVLWANVTALIDEEIAVSADAKQLRRIKRGIGAGITRSELLKVSKLAARDFDKYLDTLVQTGEVIRSKKLPDELGLERATNRPIEWVSAGRSVPRSVRNNGAGGGTESNLDETLSSPVGEMGNREGNREIPELISDIPLSSHFSLSPLSIDETRPRGGVEESDGERELRTSEEDERWGA
jgi:hypothetical protein